MVYFRNQHNDPTQIGAMLLAFGGGLLWSGIRRFKKNQYVDTVGASRIGTAPQGLVKFQGHAWPTHPFFAPLSGDAVVHYSIQVQEYRSSGNKRKSWVTVFEDKTEQPFFIVQSDGRAIVFPLGSETNCRTIARTWHQLEETQKSVVLSAIHSKNPSYADRILGIFPKSIRVIESTIVVGSELTIIGSFRTVSGLEKIQPLQGYATFLHKVQFLERGKNAIAGGMDVAHAGLVAAREASGDFGTKPVVVSAHQETGKCFGEVISTSETPLYIADCEAKDLDQRLSSSNFLRMLGGVLLMTAGAIVLKLRLSKLF